MFQIVSLLSQFYIGELKMGWNRLQAKKGEINTGENNPVYSTCTIVYIKYHITKKLQIHDCTFTYYQSTKWAY